MTEGNNKSGSINFIPAKCPSCGGELRVPENIDLVKCMYCGSDVILHDSSKVIVEPRIDISNIKNLAKSAEIGNNFEEAYRYYTMILEQEPNDSEAWLGKGFAAGMLSTFNNSRINEVDICFVHGLSSEKNERRTTNEKRRFFDRDGIEPSLRRIALTYYNKLINHLETLISQSSGNSQREEELRIDKIGLSAIVYSLEDDFEQIGFFDKATLRSLLIFEIQYTLAMNIVSYNVHNFPRDNVIQIRKNLTTIIEMKLSYDDDLRYDPKIQEMLDNHVMVAAKKDSFWRKLFP